MASRANTRTLSFTGLDDIRTFVVSDSESEPEPTISQEGTDDSDSEADHFEAFAKRWESRERRSRMSVTANVPTSPVKALPEVGKSRILQRRQAAMSNKDQQMPALSCLVGSKTSPIQVKQMKSVKRWSSMGDDSEDDE